MKTHVSKRTRHGHGRWPLIDLEARSLAEASVEEMTRGSVSQISLLLNVEQVSRGKSIPSIAAATDERDYTEKVQTPQACAGDRRCFYTYLVPDPHSLFGSSIQPYLGENQHWTDQETRKEILAFL